MTNSNGEVVIVGGGIAGIATAYFLGRAGVKTTVVERDSIGSHASGFAYGGLSPGVEAGAPGDLVPMARVASEGMRLHRELAQSLPEETGVNTEYRQRPSLSLVFGSHEAQSARDLLARRQSREGQVARWLDAEEVHAIEPRVSQRALGGVYTDSGADVEPYRFVLALTRAAESLGTTIRHGQVTGLKREGERVVGVTLGGEEMGCDRVVLAMGPWSGEASSWLNVPIDVAPLKGQILRLRAPGPPFNCSIGWAGNYAITKPDGLLWAGTTEEHAGFDEAPTPAGRDSIMGSLLKMIPSLGDFQLVQQTACLRPVSADGELLLGPVPGWEGVYMATGAGHQGILLGPAMGWIIADLIARGESDIPTESFSPGRFIR